MSSNMMIAFYDKLTLFSEHYLPQVLAGSLDHLRGISLNITSVEITTYLTSIGRRVSGSGGEKIDFKITPFH